MKKKNKMVRAVRMTRGMTRGSQKMTRTKFPVKNHYVTLKYAENRYFVSTTKFSRIPIYLTKHEAFFLYGKLKKKFGNSFMIKMVINNMTRTLIKE